MQNDFIDPTHGSLAVPGAEKVIDKINELTKSDMFDMVVATQDWHPENHISFASRHNVPPFSVVGAKDEMVWPDHCVQGTWGAELHSQLDDCGIDMIIRKGMNIDVDSYSALFDNDVLEYTPLVNYLNSLNMKEIVTHDIYVCGIATDVCVLNTIEDLLKCYSEDFNIHLIADASAATSKENQVRIIEELKSTTVKLFNVSEVLK